MTNLITDAWIPVRDTRGIRRISPIELPSAGAMAIASPRADFDASIRELLIGLFQTVAAPRDDIEWEDWAEEPPTRDAVEKMLAPFAPAFELAHKKHPFLQERGLDESDMLPISNLLIETPGKQTVSDNKDLFIKRREAGIYCGACTAIALYTLQSFSPAGGAGHMTSIRGGGPLSTTLVGPDLWLSTWLNVLPRPAFGGKAVTKPSADVFPWLHAPDDPKGKRSKLHTKDIHPSGVYWGMPRRVELAAAEEAGARCSICAEVASDTYAGYRTRPYGFDYEGSWIHPLSPRQENEGETSAVKGRLDLGGYRQWVGLVASNEGGTRGPARAVEHFRATAAKHTRGAGRLRLSGYAMDNAKVEGWCEGIMPELLAGEDAVRSRVDAHARVLVNATHDAAGLLRGAYKEAHFDRPKDVKGDFGFVTAGLWTRTESPFYTSLRAVASSADAKEEERVNWWRRLRRETIDLFETQVHYARLGDANPKRIFAAERKLHDLLRKSVPKKLELNKEQITRG